MTLFYSYVSKFCDDRCICTSLGDGEWYLTLLSCIDFPTCVRYHPAFNRSLEFNDNTRTFTRPINEAGVYLRGAFIRGNTVIVNY